MPRKANKSTFVRDNIALSNEEIVEKAKEAGLGTISLGLIYNLRSAAKKSSTPKSKKAAVVSATTASGSGSTTPGAPNPAATSSGRKSRKKKGKGRASGSRKQAKAFVPALATTAAAGGASPSDFVRSLPATLSAKEVQAKGAEQGIKFSVGLVYAARKYKPKKSGAAKAAPAAAPVAVPSVKARRGPKPKVSVPNVPGGAAQEKTFLELAVAIGLARSTELLAQLGQSVASFIAAR